MYMQLLIIPFYFELVIMYRLVARTYKQFIHLLMELLYQ